MTAPRGVPVAVRSVPATSVVPDGPWRIAAAPIPAAWPGPSGIETMPVPPKVGSSAPSGPSADDGEGRRVDARRAAADGEGQRALGAHEQPGDAAGEAERGAVERAAGAEGRVGAAVREQPDDDRDLARPHAAEDHVAVAVHRHRAELGARRAGQHVAEAGAEARVDLARGQQPDRHHARRAVGLPQRPGGDDPPVAERRQRAHAVERRAGKRRDDLAAGAELRVKRAGRAQPHDDELARRRCRRRARGCRR